MAQFAVTSSYTSGSDILVLPSTNVWLWTFKAAGKNKHEYRNGTLCRPVGKSQHDHKKKNHILQTCMEDVHIRECLVIHSAGHVAVILLTHPANTLWCFKLPRKPVGKTIYCSAEAHLKGGRGEARQSPLDRNLKKHIICRLDTKRFTRFNLQPKWAIEIG